MSAAAPSTDPVQNASSGKKKGGKKKKIANKPKEPIETDSADPQPDNAEDGDDEPETPVQASAPIEEAGADEPTEKDTTSNGHTERPTSNGHANPPIDKPAPEQQAAGPDATAKLDALTKEREALRSEVEQLRKQLETIQETHSETVTQLKSELEETSTAKEQAEESYQALLERVNHLKSTLGERLKRDRAELEEAKERIEELESQNEELQNDAKASEEEVAKLKEELQDTSREATSLRSRSNLSQQNWVKEREELTRLVASLKEEVETTTNAMGEWEVIAMEERSVKESLAEKVSELEEQVANLRDGYESAASERDQHSQVIDSLQKALREIQDARKRELREMVETSEEQLQAMKKLVQEADSRATEAEAAKENLTKELERTAPFEKEVKEKNLLIGKLRHEAIVLNDHLTKALRYLKKTKPEDNVDRQVVTNHLLHFLMLDRSDPKRFQILQVMAGYLNWTDEQREQAGLARPGTSNNNLRLPASPFHRTPSTPSLSADFFSETPTSANKESLADLWAGFLERSAEEGLDQAGGGPPRDRKDSGSSAATGPTRPDTRGGA
ncbi:GRIP domain-containing protein C119.12 [Colletotrichum spaethianum]|uniref:GRIP domain-containing protein C119.12 n=1 Tax=Colletotrichum spaethianum TaxID=700344 RepID=A0AA37USI8_9PEZI|nr:GRIP domain-containing protein C119.12 [Colletotrichum spaethianum]GKT49938.1 GRIP domain-containing protein C119.12 [Colletotrichum spaethianum]